MATSRPELPTQDRAELLRIASSRRSAQGLARRARLVLDSAEVGPAEAARRSGVSAKTATKWWQRYAANGLPGLHDSARSGRPPITPDLLRQVLGCALEDPPGSSSRWTTRTIADAAGVSQATVSRIRRRCYPCGAPESIFLRDSSTATLEYLDVSEFGCAVGFLAVSGSPGPGSQSARSDVIETALCASLLREPGPVLDPAATIGGSAAVAVLARASERIPDSLAVTLFVDVPLDAEARRWLGWHPGITAYAVPGERWFGLLDPVAQSIGPRQLPELRGLQQLIRAARRAGEQEFTWVRGSQPAAPTALIEQAKQRPSDNDIDRVVRGICAAIAGGELEVGAAIGSRVVAARSGLPAGRVSGALTHLADEAILLRQAGQYVLPAPRPDDVIETYTARGLLGTALVRTLAADQIELPAAVHEHCAELTRCVDLGLVYEASAIDLDLQDELVRAAAMPRIGSMFLRLTLQLRIFVTILGLSYRYPMAEIVADDLRIIEQIGRHTPETAVEAWRTKIDNSANYMLGHLRAQAATRAAAAASVSDRR